MGLSHESFTLPQMLFLFSLLFVLSDAGIVETTNETESDATVSSRNGRKSEYEFTYNEPDRREGYSPIIYKGSFKQPPMEYMANAQAPPMMTSTEAPAKQYNIPTGFADFMPDNSYSAPPSGSNGDVKPRRYYKPYQNNNVQKSGPGNWNDVKGDMSSSEAPVESNSNNKGGNPGYSYWYQPYKGVYFTPEQVMVMMAQMAPQEEKSKLGQFLKKVSAEPVPFVVATLLPLSIILAAVLPPLLNLMAANGNIPLITTTATGNTARMINENLLLPVLDAIGTYGSRAIDQPECMQKIICEVARGKTKNETTPMQRAIYKASAFVGDSWLETFGVKNLVQSLRDGNCDKMQCSKKKNSSLPTNSEQ